MGGRNRFRTQRRHFKQGRENVWKRTKSDAEQQQDNSNPTDENTNNNPNPTWEPLTTQSPAFEEYYKEQGIVTPEEWDAFMECLRTALPAAFRINSSSPFYMDIRSQLQNDFVKSLQAEGNDGSEVEAIRPLPWYPDNLAWQSNFSRKQLRKNQTLERFHEFLKLENEIGNVTRQEAVSMVPPLFLDVLPDHFVLDMCAAPGSKTFQLLEMIHQLTEPGSLPNGMVITIGKERYTVGEALFRPSVMGLEADGIVEQLVHSISTVSSENHRQLLENTVLCGGTASMTGFEDRFQKEASLCSSAIRPSLVKPPEYMPENLITYSAWVGGAILAKVVFPQNQHITKADYDESGPAIVHRKCF